MDMRAACARRAERALELGAHESAVRWASLALGTLDATLDDDGTARARARGREGWLADARALEIKGDALVGSMDVRGGVGAYRAARTTRARARGGTRGGGAGRASEEEMAREEAIGMKLARALASIGDATALVEAREVLEATPVERRTLEHGLLSARIARSEGRDRAAVTGYKEVLLKWPFAIEAAVALAELGVKAVDTRRALRDAATDEDARSAEFGALEAYVTAFAALEAEDTLTARNAVAQLRQEFPNDPFIAEARARINADNDRDAESAMREYAAIRARDPHFVRGMDEYGLMLYDNGHKQSLEALSSEMLRLSPHASESWTCAALYFETKLGSGRGGREEAFAAAEKAVRINPRSHVALLVLGSIYLRANRYKSAVRAFNQCNAIKVSLKAYHGLVKAYLALGSTANAMMCARQAHKRSPQNALAWSLLGDVHARNRDEYEKAIKAYEQALAYNPRLVRAVKSLAALNIKMGKVHVARAILQRQLDDYRPSDEDELIQLYCRLAQVLMLSRQTAESVKYYTRALAIRPDCVIAQKALEKFEQTRNPKFAAALSEEDVEGNEDHMMDDDVESRENSEEWMEQRGA
ncbi:Tetratricopeptide repeat [Ostreococcus tauri]|uniref:Tetratricopeptide repeat n=2 Tax=Ostreococcus tauri TaxID=70448 RepID=Q014A1_OSTTA|nr:Tetratricopeptide repeat [Ostreococcus tauri]CAL54778.1 Tetratricopeptide repeat [Ostreococcus tauri]|eukprot:XP_003080610.1 Tetratricopeptide repeat [Ostreococcus tauri]